METLRTLYRDKQGAERYFALTRHDVVRLLQRHFEQSGKRPVRILEIGCSSGGTGLLAKKTMGVDYYAGVELMPEAAVEAQANLDWVMQGNIEELIDQGKLGEIPHAGSYDAILFLDVLEHLYNPWRVVEAVKPLLAPGGVLVGSIPNAGNLYVLWKLAMDRFEYDDEGLLDRTHLRFFTLHTIKQMLRPHYMLERLETNHTTWKTMNWQGRFFYLLTLGMNKRIFIRQYLFVARKKDESNA